MNSPARQRRGRVTLLAAGLGGAFVLVATRLAMLVLLDGPRLLSMAHNEHSGELELTALRGAIEDRKGVALALSAETRSIYARPGRLLEASSAADRAALARALGTTPLQLDARLRRKSPFIWLARHVPPGAASAVDELGLDGVHSVPEYQRFYPESGLAAAVVGLAGMDGQGLSGVELSYDHVVRGAPTAISFYHDATGRQILDSPMELRRATPGARVELTIDSTIQAAAENFLGGELKTSGARSGAAIVLDPFTGEVLAMADASRGAPDRLHNAAIQDAFEPGSTMKGLLAAIAMEQRVIGLKQRVFCENGAWRFAGKIIHDDSPHQWLDLGQIIEVSSNIGAAKIALTLGNGRFAKGLASFGLGRRTEIDLPGESAGLLRNPTHWRPLELADHGFGQGIAVTPIQLASAYAAIANGGLLMRPYVVKAAYNASGKELFEHTPQAVDRVISPDTAHLMNQLLRGVVDAPDGTGRLAQVADFTVAGKTGTAQMVNPATGAYYQNRLVASFAGFVPAQDPKLVILVVLYDVAHGHFGGLYAAPVFSQIASATLQHLQVMPAHPEYDLASLLPLGSSAAAEASLSGAAGDDGPGMPAAPSSGLSSVEAFPGQTPDFIGLSLRSALALARARALKVQVDGSGYVLRQSPRAGAKNRGSLNLVLASKGDRSINSAVRSDRWMLNHASGPSRSQTRSVQRQ